MDIIENPFPDDLEKRLEVVLGAMSNVFHRLILLELNQGPANIVDLRNRIERKIDQPEKVHLAGKEAFSSYLRNRLYKPGLVAEDKTEKPAIFYLTDAGKKYGVPISMFISDYEFRTKKSFIEILGTSPFNRIRVLEKLRKKDLSLKDLASKLNATERGILTHLKSLGKMNFIKYESCGDAAEGKGELFYYTWKQGKKSSKVQIVGGYTLLTSKVAKCLEDHGKLDAHQIAEKIKVSSAKTVSVVLGGLTKQDFAQRGRWKVGEVLSNISLLPDGEKLLVNFSDKIGLTLNDNQSLNKMQQLYDKTTKEIGKTEKIYTNSLKLYVETSSSQNRTPIKISLRKIIEFVRENPGSRAGEILSQLGLPTFGGTYLKDAVEKGHMGAKLRKEGTGRKTRYYVAEKTNKL